MSFLDDLFSPGEQTTTSSSVTTPTMPEYAEDAFESEAQRSANIQDRAGDLSHQLADNPLEILGLSKEEQAAVDKADKLSKEANADTDALSAGLAAGNHGDLGEYQTTAGLQDNLGDLYGVEDLQDASYADRLAANENQYTDAVVDTTLAGMQRQAEREAAARSTANAAIGGTSNTRQAVADAVASNLSGMSQAEMEAKLRSDAFNTASATTLTQQQNDRANELAKAGLSTEQAKAQAAQEAAAREFDFTQAQDERTYGADQFGREITYADTQEGLNDSSYLRALGIAGLQGDTATAARELEQAQLESNRNAGMEAMDWQAGINDATSIGNSGLPIGTTTETTGTTPTASTGSQILGTVASVAGAAIGASDERVKRSVAPVQSALEKIGMLSAKEYRYKKGFGHTRARTSGLMAQDVERAGIKGGVVEIDGIKHVDFYPILATVVQAVNELRQERLSHG